MNSKQSEGGWADRLVAWINALPIPVWLFYLLVIVILGLVNSLSAWSIGTRPWGVFEFESATDGIWPTFFIGYMVMLVNRGKAAFNKYRPLLPNADERDSAVEQRFTMISRRTGRIALLLSAIAVAATIIAFLTSGDPLSVPDMIYQLYIMSFVVLVNSVFFAMLLFLLRQIRIIQRLHKEAEGVDLFDLGPAHAFSELTAGTGIGLMLIATFGVFQVWNNPANTFYFVLDGVMMVCGVLVFFVPLRGMRQKLREVKAEELRNANQRLKSVYERLNQGVASENYTDVSALNTAISALTQERNEIARISTLPWDTATFRGFASSILLPVTLFIITQLLGRFF
jgi:hypothetical protein